MSASWCLVSIYLIWISGSRLILSNNQSKATPWVLDTCLIVGLLPLIIIWITASFIAIKNVEHRTQSVIKAWSCNFVQVLSFYSPVRNVFQRIQCLRPVRGSFFAEVHRVLVRQMEEEDDREYEWEDEGEDGKQRVEGRVAENQNNHIMSAWRWHMYDERATHFVLEPMSMWH